MNAETPASGELRWNIKQSFRDYVGELPDGEETRVGDTGGLEDGDLVFPAVAASALGDAGAPFVLRFAGGVRFFGYRGMLRVDINEPWVETNADGTALITADVAPAGSTPQRVSIVEFDGTPAASNNGWEWSPAGGRLTAAGATLLGSVYQPGAEADGLVLRVTEVRP